MRLGLGGGLLGDEGVGPGLQLARLLQQRLQLGRGTALELPFQPAHLGADLALLGLDRIRRRLRVATLLVGGQPLIDQLRRPNTLHPRGFFDGFRILTQQFRIEHKTGSFTRKIPSATETPRT